MEKYAGSRLEAGKGVHYYVAKGRATQIFREKKRE